MASSQIELRQYLYLSASKASKLSTSHVSTSVSVRGIVDRVAPRVRLAGRGEGGGGGVLVVYAGRGAGGV